MASLTEEQRKEYLKLLQKSRDSNLTDDNKKDLRRHTESILKDVDNEKGLLQKHFNKVMDNPGAMDRFINHLDKEINKLERNYQQKVGVAKQHGLLAPILVALLKTRDDYKNMQDLKEIQKEISTNGLESFGGKTENAQLFFNQQQTFNNQQNNLSRGGAQPTQ